MIERTIFRQVLRKVSISLALLIPAGCINAPVQMKLGNNDHVTTKNPTLQPDSCKVVVNSLQDIRKDKQSMGTIGVHPITGDELLEWIESTLSKRQFDFSPFELNSNVINISISLKLVHMRTSESIMKTNLVLQIHDQNHNHKFNIRGSDTKVLWFGSENEFEESFSRALVNATEKIQLGIQSNCTLEKIDHLPPKPVKKPLI